MVLALLRSAVCSRSRLLKRSEIFNLLAKEADSEEVVLLWVVSETVPEETAADVFSEPPVDAELCSEDEPQPARVQSRKVDVKRAIVFFNILITSLILNDLCYEGLVFSFDVCIIAFFFGTCWESMRKVCGIFFDSDISKGN